MKADKMTIATVAVIDGGKIYLADFPVNNRVLYGFFYEGDNTMIRAAKALFGLSPDAYTRDFVHADYIVDGNTGEVLSAKASRDTFVRRVKEEARHLAIIKMLTEEI